MEAFREEISRVNGSVRTLKLKGEEIPLVKPIQRRKKYIYVGDSDINRAGSFCFTSRLVFI